MNTSITPGQLFGYLQVRELTTTNKGYPTWDCVCLCGDILQMTTKELHRGRWKECSCMVTFETVSRRYHQFLTAQMKETTKEHAIMLRRGYGRTAVSVFEDKDKRWRKKSKNSGNRSKS